MGFIRALIPVTSENFDPKAYLLANPDVAAAKCDPELHFELHGRGEQRRQTNLNFLEDSAAFRKAKFGRFRPLLNLATNADTFPISADGRHFSRSDYKEESANGEFGPFINEMVAHPESNYLDVGCGFRHTVYANCLYVEVYPSLTADLIVPPDCTYPIKDEAFDGIGCFAVLEHTRKPWLVVQEMHRMLKPGGKVWIDWPFLQPVHGYPSHYFNATREGLKSIFEDAGFQTESIETGPFQGLDHTITWSMSEFLNKLPEKARKRIGKMSVDAFISHRAGSEFWREILADVDEKTKETLACGNTLIAVKQ